MSHSKHKPTCSVKQDDGALPSFFTDDAAACKVSNSLLLGGVSFKVPGLPIGVDLAMFLKDSSIFCRSTEVLGDDGINAIPQVLVMRVSSANRT